LFWKEYDETTMIGGVKRLAAAGLFLKNTEWIPVING